MIGTIIVMLIVGLIAGFIARALVPGRDAMGIGATLVLGLVGSFIGGFLGYLLFNHDGNDGAFQPSGIIGSVIGAIIALLVWRAVNGRGTGRARL
ncbi:putative membrane protein YeaQ/YmgE (transglycosylase-associated protein family) [Motilibacter rhizosphaerae]|uniref:Putative membrane protein YeaQ/YmgE (Transglycosylase-associated protein family) n=1 Tax=Motilibacter rhizosphaerae TaxID=598652 RepID=A0A4Q7NRB2_9ACTN|nr:GlsB/YeaQ/YmgE family stress response membrane protein [Motilibacter rhizosphaerae]RZS89613.1 putative membrane protein YeaQ/YmgE (transglycosylase-associated protein family) [Motilibacter rhizosphaerae]